ncbi:phage tail tube protein [Aromatoleum toluclasticum]|uniref:phage tail tube protein n=1 Tax=Aromatoleum toluclasticum TaxID=92003 RepID=UPI000371A74E|nr:hypothetical protein [Aromatoleum toluclasticum]
MPRVSLTRGYKGKGHISLRPLNGLGRKFRLGNVVSLSETIETDRQAREDFQEAGGGELDVSETVTSVTAELNVNDIKPETIAIGMRGTHELLAAQALTNEAQSAWSGERVTFNYIPDPDVAPVVKIDATAAWAQNTVYVEGDLVLDTARAYLCIDGGTSGGVEPTWPVTAGQTVTDGTAVWRDLGTLTLTKDTHYAVTPQGIRFIAGGADLFIGDSELPLKVDYTRNPQYVIQALVNSGTEYEVIFDGLNEVDSGNPFVGRYFRCKFSPTSGFSRIGNEFAEMTLSMTVLKDENRVGTGLSQYMEFQMI